MRVACVRSLASSSMQHVNTVQREGMVGEEVDTCLLMRMCFIPNVRYTPGLVSSNVQQPDFASRRAFGRECALKVALHEGTHVARRKVMGGAFVVLSCDNAAEGVGKARQRCWDDETELTLFHRHD